MTNRKPNQPVKRRTTSSRSSSKETSCPCRINIWISSTGEYFLEKSTNLCHKGHSFISPEAKSISMSDISDKNCLIASTLSASGVTPTHIKTFLEEIEQNEGVYQTTTISNIIQRNSFNEDKVMGLSHNMSSAEKIIKYLKE